MSDQTIYGIMMGVGLSILANSFWKSEFGPLDLYGRELAGLVVVADRDSLLPRLTTLLDGCVVQLAEQSQLPLSLTNSRARKPRLITERSSHFSYDNLMHQPTGEQK